MEKAEPIKLDSRIEFMRDKHVDKMIENRQEIKRTHDCEQRKRLQQEYDMMKEDLFEFDSWFLDMKYRLIHKPGFKDAIKPSYRVYVNLDTGIGYTAKTEAVKISGLPVQAFERKLVSKYSPEGNNWRVFQESYTL